MNIEKGWRFCTADFSIQAAGRGTIGRVMLIREPSEVAKWQSLPDEVVEGDDCPPLCMHGEGETFEEAITNANLGAAHARPVLSKEKIGRNDEDIT